MPKPSQPVSSVTSAATPEVRVNHWFITLFRPIYWLFIHSFFKISMLGKEKIPSSGPVLLVPTHRSRWDPVLMGDLTPRILRFMASQDEFVGTQGFCMKLFGAFPVNTGRPSPTTLKTCVSILKRGDLLVIFAEGTIFYYPPDNVHPLRPGAAWLALKVQNEMPGTSLKVVPVRVRYSVIRPKFRDGAQLQAYPAIDVSKYLDRPDKQAIADLTADIQAGMGDILNTSKEEMLKPVHELKPGGKRKSYGRV